MKKTAFNNYSAPEMEVLELEMRGCIATSPQSDGIEQPTYDSDFDNWS